ncbi:MAG: P44/Msp2 family outer membrane protein [Candidatus Poribacteria bacterium]|nr:P44/Msp2 family outer membrane protein [Candidatus Poribacteria bacterium]
MKLRILVISVLVFGLMASHAAHASSGGFGVRGGLWQGTSSWFVVGAELQSESSSASPFFASLSGNYFLDNDVTAIAGDAVIGYSIYFEDSLLVPYVCAGPGLVYISASDDSATEFSVVLGGGVDVELVGSNVIPTLGVRYFYFAGGDQLRRGAFLFGGVRF